MRLTPERLWALLGQDGAAGTARVVLDPAVPLGPHRLHPLTMDRDGVVCRGFHIRPGGPGPHGAVVYCHAHGNRYAVGAVELIEGRPALQAPYGAALADLGIASVAIDLAPFGGRQGDGPEHALAKAALWQGRPLIGQMLAELRALHGWLAARPDIDAARIGTLGLSMGGTLAYWLAALEPRLAACAHLCVLADTGPLIATGAHDLHGPYMTVPGLLAQGDMGDVAGLIAPRPQFVGLGGLDPLTPPPARAAALARLGAAYGADAGVTVHLSPETGHAETPAMRAAVLAFLARHLGR